MNAGYPLDIILEELSVNAGRVHFGLPPLSQNISEYDLVFLKSWNASDLLVLARRGVFQVAVYSEKPIDEDLSAFYDWQISQPVMAGRLQQMAVNAEGDGTKSQTKARADQVKKSALFLDRDGVVNVDHGYVGDPLQVELIPYLTELIGKVNQSGKQVIVVTNQSGIGRGFYSEEDFQKVMIKISELLKAKSVHIDHMEFSPFHPQAVDAKYRRGRQLRKPRPGMIHRAAQSHKVDLRSSTLVGDRMTDLVAGILAGVGHLFLLKSDQNKQDQQKFEQWTERIMTKHQLPSLMDGVNVQALNGLDKAQL